MRNAGKEAEGGVGSAWCNLCEQVQTHMHLSSSEQVLAPTSRRGGSRRNTQSQNSTNRQRLASSEGLMQEGAKVTQLWTFTVT